MADQTSLSARRQLSLEAWLVFPAALIFYVCTLAPTVLWGDSGYLQRSAALGLLDSDGAGRALWFAAARLMLRLPLGELAFRVNLLSALAGALTVLLIHRASLAAGLSRRGAFVAAAVLAVSHTFWQHSVRAEVYTPFMALLALQVWLWFRWAPGRTLAIATAVTLCGLTLLAHQMAALIAPALLLFCIARRKWLAPGQWLQAAAAGATGAALAVFVLQWQTHEGPIQALRLYLTHAGSDFGPALFGFSWSSLPKDLLWSAAFIVLQFPGPALLLLILAAPAVVRRARFDAAWAAALVLALTDFLFAFDYRVNDRYVFFLPLYAVGALFVGQGWDVAERRWHVLKSKGAWLTAALLLCITPVAAYASAATLTERLGINPLQIRSLPGRNPGRYFLWPASQGYADAEAYARSALAVAPLGAVILADYTPYAPLSYVQLVEKRGAVAVRVILVAAGDDLGAVVAGLPPGVQVFLADIDPRYYNLASLPAAQLARAGPLYHLLR